MNSATSIEIILAEIKVSKAELTVRCGYTSNVVYKWGKTISAPPTVMLYLKALKRIKELEDADRNTFLSGQSITSGVINCGNEAETSNNKYTLEESSGCCS